MKGYSWFCSHGEKHAGVGVCVCVFLCAGRLCLLCMMLVSLGYTVMTIQTWPGVFIKPKAPGSGQFVGARTHFSQIRDGISSIQLSNSSCNRCSHLLVNRDFPLQPQSLNVSTHPPPCVYLQV